MKEMMTRLIRFITFDTPLQTEIISIDFKSIHTSQQERFDSWSTNSTRYKLMDKYWFNSVLKHFLFLLALSAFSVIGFQRVNMLSISLFGLLSLLIIYFFSYKRLYNLIFLPKVEMIQRI